MNRGRSLDVSRADGTPDVGLTAPLWGWTAFGIRLPRSLSEGSRRHEAAHAAVCLLLRERAFLDTLHVVLPGLGVGGLQAARDRARR